MKFTAKGRQYEIDSDGIITQLDYKPYNYDPNYSAIYDGPQYREKNDELMQMRWDFIRQVSGERVNSVYDIGFGNGAFLKHIRNKVPKRYGFDITGVEIEDVYLMPGITDIKSEVATMFDVLEHFPDCSFLHELECKTLFISLPYCHVVPYGIEWFENNYPHAKPDEHIRHFWPGGLKEFMSRYGWRFYRQSYHEDIVRKSKHGLQNIISMAFKKI